jgi:hypothetical protein
MSNFPSVAKAGCLVALLALTACAPALRSAPDPAFRKAVSKDVVAAEVPQPVRVEVQFQQDGVTKPEYDGDLRDRVQRTLTATHVLQPDVAAPAVLRVVVNNISDKDAAIRAGIVTGLTFGLSGGVVSDEFHFRFIYTPEKGDKREQYFRHVMRTATGSAPLPAGLTPLAPEAAYGKVVEDAVLSFLVNYQQDQIANR